MGGGGTTKVSASTSGPSISKPGNITALNVTDKAVVVTLSWAASGSRNCDYDLAVTEPNGDRISFRNRVSDTGGMLNADSLGIRVMNSETISWHIAPSGWFAVEASVYNGNDSRNGCLGSDATLTYTIDGVASTYQLDMRNSPIDGPGITVD